ncbi:Alpha/Beta hydrolase protein [Hyaloraphidium curvatum]|nr:Alpha/Beta hydrolase protein [Hyaloraphidium curvatum]
MAPTASDLSSFPLRTARVNGIDMRFVDARPDGRELGTMIFIHGFPEAGRFAGAESWMEWRHQIPHFVAKGYRVIAPNTRGYNKGEPRPRAADKELKNTHYTLANAARDMKELLDHCGVKKAIVVAHDWGAVLSMRFYNLYPEYFEKYVLICIPYSLPPAQYVPIEEAAKAVKLLNYQVYFNSDKAEDELNEQTDLFINFFFSRMTRDFQRGMDMITPTFGVIDSAKANGYPRNDCLLSAEEIEAYKKHMREIGGWGGPLQWYRMGETTYRDFNDGRKLQLEVEVPLLFIGPQFDSPFWKGAASDAMRKHAKDLTLREIAKAGHWVAYEKPDEVNAIISEWLDARAAAEPKM